MGGSTARKQADRDRLRERVQFVGVCLWAAGVLVGAVLTDGPIWPWRIAAMSCALLGVALWARGCVGELDWSYRRRANSCRRAAPTTGDE